MAKISIVLDEDANYKLKGLTQRKKGGVSGLLFRIATALANDPGCVIRRIGNEAVIESSSTIETEVLHKKGETSQYPRSTELEELHSKLDLIYGAPVEAMRKGIIANLESWGIVAEVVRNVEGGYISPEGARRIREYCSNLARGAPDLREEGADLRAGNQ